MQKRKNISLLVILLFLIGVNVLVFSLESNNSNTSFDEKLFAVQDTATIERIVITTKNFTNEIKKVNNQWIVNNKYPLDEGLRRTLLPVLKEIRVRRGVADSQKEQIQQLIDEKGIKVDIYHDSGLSNSFLLAGDPDENLSYFMKPDDLKPYVVHLPGYESYVAGLFEITENDWRDRIVMNINWQSLNQLGIDYPENPEKNFSIKAGSNFFTVPKLNEFDTSKVYDYLQQAQYILADKYLKRSEFSRYDSLSDTEPYAKLTVENIGDKKPKKIEFYPLQNNDKYMLGKTDNEELALFEYSRIKNLFVGIEHFKNLSSNN